MKHVATTFTPSAYVTFTDEEVELLIKCATNHYDGVCKDAAKEEPMGMLIRIRNCANTAGFNYEHRLSFRDLDTMAKILEISGYFRPKVSEKLWMDLQTQIKAALLSLNDSAVKDITINP